VPIKTRPIMCYYSAISFDIDNGIGLVESNNSTLVLQHWISHCLSFRRQLMTLSVRRRSQHLVITAADKDDNFTNCYYQSDLPFVK